MGPLMSRWLVDAEVAIARSDTLAALERRLRRITDVVLPMANRDERSFLVRSAMAQARRCRASGAEDRAEWLTAVRNAKVLESAANGMDRRLQVKAKRRILAGTLEDGRRSGTVFYAVTTHQMPRDAHRAFQGTVCYDASAEKSAAVRRYIRENGLRSVQELSGPPVWLGTSNYCRHRFVPLDTEEVLAGTANTVIRDGAHRSLTPTQRYRAYKARRERVRERCRAYRDRER